MKWARSKEGCLEIDHRFSPGHQYVPEGTRYTSATATCAHCNAIVILRPDRSRERGYCRKCDDYICDACMAVKDCNPFTKHLDDTLEEIYRELQKEKL